MVMAGNEWARSSFSILIKCAEAHIIYYNISVIIVEDQLD